MSTIDTIIVDKQLERNIFMNKYEETTKTSEVWIYDDLYCFPNIQKKQNQLCTHCERRKKS